MPKCDTPSPPLIRNKIDLAGAQRSQSPVGADKGGDGIKRALPSSGILVNIAHIQNKIIEN
jgi:hypothetical protein